MPPHWKQPLPMGTTALPEMCLIIGVMLPYDKFSKIRAASRKQLFIGELIAGLVIRR